MESTSQTSANPLLFRVWALLFIGIGLYRLADWALSGYAEMSSLLSGTGFLLLAPGARFGAIPREHLPAQPRRRLWLVCSWAGAALVVAAIVVRRL